MDTSALHTLAAGEAARLIAEGVITSVQLVEACLARVREVDERVQAWAFLDPAYAVAQARALDDARLAGQAIGGLHGIPVALKDIMDTADMPTENGSPLCAGRTPSRDASVVAMVRGAGAVIMGKTVTTELATRHPGKTRNPHHPGHTPGGSSSGSAAAVAAGMVPLALGSQTTGSVIRPAAYCGVYGFKPTHGLIPRHGMLSLSRSLDHVGLFARHIDDIALLLEHVVGHDERDPDTRPRPRVAYRDVAAAEPAVPPRLAFVKTPYWDQVDGDARDGFTELVDALGDGIDEVSLSPLAEQAYAWQRVIGDAEIAASLSREYEHGRDQLSPSLRARLEHAREVRAREYLLSLAGVPSVAASISEIFARYDAIVTPAASGTAPAGLESTGDPVFCALWTLCGMPAINVPLLQGASGLPLGVQLVGPRHGDARLLRTAAWMVAGLDGERRPSFSRRHGV